LAIVPNVASPDEIIPATSSGLVPRNPRAVPAAPSIRRPSAPGSLVAASSWARRSRESGAMPASASLASEPRPASPYPTFTRVLRKDSRVCSSKSWTTSSRSTPEVAAVVTSPPLVSSSSESPGRSSRYVS
jgi:hypothetical protein